MGMCKVSGDSHFHASLSLSLSALPLGSRCFSPPLPGLSASLGLRWPFMALLFLVPSSRRRPGAVASSRGACLGSFTVYSCLQLFFAIFF